MLPQNYDFYLADTDAGRRIHYNLRYQVYCLREQFEDPSSHPSFLEQDQYDDMSVHFIARSHATGEWLGAMRLVIAPVQRLPVSKISSTDLKHLTGISRKRAAEASRLCTLMPMPHRSTFALTTKKASHPPSVSHHRQQCFTNLVDCHRTHWGGASVLPQARNPSLFFPDQ
jgi:N-acyl amino acid synthase of PEP-CTERM/exosortase system